MELRKKEKKLLEDGKRHRKIEEEKGLVPPSFLLFAEIGRMLDTVYRFKVSETEGVSYTARAILRVLDRVGEMSQAELSKRGHISAAAVSMELADMDRAGLIERKREEGDNRRNTVRLTARGKEKQKLIIEGEKNLTRVLERGLTETEKETLSKMLISVRNNMVDAFEDIEVGKEKK